MNSIAIFSAVLFALFATTNALECRPVICMIACPFGYALDVQGCPHCSCRTTPNVCRDPLFGYNCGSGIDHRSCPASHECQLHFGGFTGQCCLKPVASSTAQPSTTATTARPATSSTARATTSASGSTTRRALSRLLAFAVDSSSTSPSTTGQATTPSGTTAGQTTTGSQATTSGSRFFFNFNLLQWIDVGAK